MEDMRPAIENDELLAFRETVMEEEYGYNRSRMHAYSKKQREFWYNEARVWPEIGLNLL